MQISDSNFASCRECFKSVYASEGVNGLYRSLSTNLVMNIPFQFIHFFLYEKTQKTLNPRHEYSPVAHALSGAIAGGTAGFLTTPLDVMKTVLNTQQHNQGKTVVGMAEAFRTVRASGMKTFYRGALLRVTYMAPGSAFCWSGYELMKTLCLYLSSSKCNARSSQAPDLNTPATLDDINNLLE